MKGVPNPHVTHYFEALGNAYPTYHIAKKTLAFPTTLRPRKKSKTVYLDAKLNYKRVYPTQSKQLAGMPLVQLSAAKSTLSNYITFYKRLKKFPLEQ